jgi:putative flippase GtrA
MIKFIKKFVVNNKQIIKYGIIGCLCVGIDFTVYCLLIQVFKTSYLFANVISVNCGILSSFFLNRHFTFKIKNRLLIRLFSFYLIGLIGLAISSALLYLLVEQSGLEELVSKAFTVVVVAVIQFLLNKYISFRDGK